MIQEAEAHKAEDQKFRELAEARNMGDQVAYQLEKTLKELGDKVPSSEAERIRAKIEAIREAVKGDDPARIRMAIDDANQTFAAISQRLYEQAGAAGAQAQAAEGTTGRPAGGASSAAGDVIDAEFEAEDEN